MNEKKRQGRVAGLWYAAMALVGPFGIVYAPSQIHVPGDAAATAAHLMAHQAIAHVGVAASIACQVIFVFLVLALERLFDGIDEKLSRLMRSLVLVAVPIAILNELLVLGALEIVVGTEVPARDQIALALLNVHELGVSVVAGTFWGLWLFPFGLLAIRSGFVPKILGVLLIVGGAAYIVDASLALLAPTLRDRLTDFMMLPLAVGELSTVAWLVIKGAREPAAIVAAPAT